MRQNWPVLLLVVLGVLVPGHWFADGRLIAGGDHLAYYNPSHIFYDYFYTWLDRLNFGDPNYGAALLFPFLSFFKLLSLVGLSPVVAGALWAICLFLLPGIFMFLLVRELLPGEFSWRQGGAFVAALFYMFNPYIMTDVLQLSQRPVQMVLPLLLLLWHKGLAEEKGRLKYPLLFSLATLLTASTGTAPAFMMIIPLTLLLYTVFWFMFHRDAWRRMVVFALTTAFFSLIVNLWWLVPASLAYLQSGETLQKAIHAGNFTQSTSLWESLRLMGFWAFRINWKDLPHIPYAHFYYEPLFLFFSYSLTALAFLGLIVGSSRRFVCFFAALFLIGVFLSKGANLPWGEWYGWLFLNFPPFSLFREPFSKFTSLSLFALAVLLGLSWGKLMVTLRGRPRCLLTLFLSVVILLYSFPLVTGQVIQDPSWHKVTLDSLHVEIPPAWEEVGRWFGKNDPVGKVMLFPRSSYGTCYDWTMGTCAGEPVARMFLPNQTIKFLDVIDWPNYRVVSSFHDLVLQGLSDKISSALSFLGIRYILQQNDLDWRNSPRETLAPPEVATILANDKNLEKAVSFGKLDVYAVRNSAVYPLIYPTANLSLVYGEAADLGRLVSFREPNFSESYYFVNEASAGKNQILEPLRRTIPETFIFPKKEDEKLSGKLSVAFAEDGWYRAYSFLGRVSFSNLQLKVGEEVLSQTPPPNQNGWVGLGRKYFSAGKYPVELTTDEPPNLVNENFFAPLKTETPPTASGYRRRYTFLSREPLPVGRYRLSFSYFSPPTANVTLFLQEERCGAKDQCENKSIFETSLLLSWDVRSYENEFIIYRPAKKIILQFEADARLDGSDLLSVGNLKIIPLVNNNILFIKENTSQTQSANILPVISFRRRDPTLLEITVQRATTPYYLIFNESFNKNWQLKFKGETIPEEKHFLANSFANGWYLTPADFGGRESYSLILAYRPQKYLVLGFLVSAAGVFLAVVYLLFKSFRMKRTYA